jgi:hypothetical protein
MSRQEAEAASPVESPAKNPQQERIKRRLRGKVSEK